MKIGYLAAAAVAMMMIPQQKPRNTLHLPSFHGVAEVQSSIPGRIRLYMPAIRTQRETAEKMKRQLESTGAVREVRLNPEIGTALFLFDEKAVEAAVVEGAVIRLMGLDEQIQKLPMSHMEAGLRTLQDAINHGIMETTGGWLDARMLTGSALTVAAIRSMVVNGAALPGAFTLLWWASNIFSRNRHE